MHQVLVVGVGSIGERHVRCFGRTGRAQVGVAEPRDDLRASVQSRYGLAEAHGTLDDALQARQWDTVILCTPAHTHVALARQCLERKLPVLIEKPLAVALDDARSLRDAASAASDVPAGVAYVHRAHPALAAMRSAIHEGRLGRPLQVVSISGQHFPTYRPAYASTYFTRHETGGGTIQDALTHMLDAAQWLVGPVTHLAADVAQYRLTDTQVEDTVHLMARHGQVMAMYAQNQHQAPNETTLTVVCEGGTARYLPTREQWMWQTDPQGQWQVEPAVFSSRDAWFERQAQAWLAVIEGKAAPLCTIPEACHTVALHEAALRSSRQDRQWIDLQTLDHTPQAHARKAH